MGIYYPGYNKARKKVQEMELEELLSLIDDLYGRDNLNYGDTVEDVREEALAQLQREFTDPHPKAYREYK